MREPFGTLVLTLSMSGMEMMMIAAVMFTGHGSATLARDTMLAILMIVLNGVVGACLLAGGLRYREQTYNLYSANSFLAVILPLAVLGLVLPSMTVTTPGSTLSMLESVFLVFMSLLTIPAVLAIGFATGQRVVLGLDGVDTVLLLLTLVVSMLPFALSRTNVLIGAVHLLLFLAYLMLMVEK